MRKHLLLLMLVITAVVICSCAVEKKPTTVMTQKNIEIKNEADLVADDSKKKITPNWDRIVKDKKILIGISNQEFNKKLIDALKPEMGMEADVTVYKNFEDAAQAIKNNDIDMYIGEFPKESKLSLDFALSNPYIQSTSVVLGKKEDYKVDKQNNVAGVVFGSAEDKTVDLYFNSYLRFSSYYELFSALNSGKVDCILIDELEYEKSGFKRNDLYVCDSHVYNLIAIFNEQCTDIAAEMNVYLAKTKASGVAGEISEEIFGKDIIYK